jgi:CheY-like chemotaxis protein
MKLEQGPFSVTLAFDGQEALDALEKDPEIRLVLLDLMMPNVSGLDVLTRMRNDARWRDVPCVILTAAGQEIHHDRAMALGATEFMTKPFSPKRLLHRAAELTGVPENWLEGRSE